MKQIRFNRSATLTLALLLLLSFSLFAARNNGTLIVYIDSVTARDLTAEGNKGAYTLQQLVEDPVYRTKVGLLSPELDSDDIKTQLLEITKWAVGAPSPAVICLSDSLLTVSKGGKTEDNDSKVINSQLTYDHYANGIYYFTCDGKNIGIAVEDSSTGKIEQTDSSISITFPVKGQLELTPQGKWTASSPR